MDLHGLVRPAAGAEPLHVIGRVNLHCTLLHLSIDAHAVVDIVDLHTHTQTDMLGESSPPPLLSRSFPHTHTSPLWVSLSDAGVHSNLGGGARAVQLWVTMT